ncbi:hypothetical protein CXB51_002943 [Gossypium anomalum]|uniref:BED-type domain-containing protein n=1 Tax=Gossypium anomalum TaxID=47600 RepID=A0A8J5ZZS7_9ROSI|nr:hypothetical protein CXB51_002943 [Gossypium anomalum]
MSDPIPKQDGSTQSSQNSSPSRDDKTTTKGNIRRKITPRAACWSHFTKYVTKENEKRARCNACTYTMESTSGSTMNLNNHLKTCLKRPRDRVRIAMRYIRASPSRLKKFNQWAKEEMIDSKAQLCLYVPTRWNSTYMMLKVAEKYANTFELYVRDDHNFFLNLIAEDEVHTFDDSKIVRRFIKVLEPFYHLTLKVSRFLHVTSNSLFEVLTDVHCHFDRWQDCEDLDIISMNFKVRDKYNKYWSEGNEINMLVYLVIIFDSRCKMSFLGLWGQLAFS